MTRTRRRGGDTPGAWDLATGSGAVATMMAAARAAAAAAGLVDDAFAAPLVHAVGVPFFTRVADGELDLAALGGDGGFPRAAELFAARARFFDDFLATAVRAGVRQVVMLAAGLDSRAYRLWWPEDTTLYEVDRSRVIEFKTAGMRSLGATPNLNRRAVGADLRNDWPTAVRRVGFDASAPTAWIAEGLLIGFLPPVAQDRLLADVTALSSPGSRLAVDCLVPSTRSQARHARSLAERWGRRGLDIDVAGLIFPGERNDVARYLGARGWATDGSGITELFSAAGLPPLTPRDLDGAPATIGYLTATRE